MSEVTNHLLQLGGWNYPVVFFAYLGARRGDCSRGRLVAWERSCLPPCCPVFTTFPTPFLQIVYDRSA